MLAKCCPRHGDKLLVRAPVMTVKPAPRDCPMKRCNRP
jgi:hypothetical protein